MALSIGSLVEMPNLRTRIVAGAAGADNLVRWAHSAEIEQPWEWLGDGDLLMTIGIGVPADEDAQLEWLSHLSSAGIAGVAIAEEMRAPELSEALLERADGIGFPILLTAYEVPFSELSRAVASAAGGELQSAVSRVSRVYELVRSTIIAQGGVDKLLGSLEALLRSRLFVADQRTLRPIFPGTAEMPVSMRNVLGELLGDRRALPGVLRGDSEAGQLKVVPVPSARPVILVAVAKSEEGADLSLLEHSATVMALEVERNTAERAERRRLGSDAFRTIVDGSVSAGDALSELRVSGLNPDSLIVIATRDLQPDLAFEVLSDNQIPLMMLSQADVLYLLCPMHSNVIDELVGIAAPSAKLGVSETFSGVDGVRLATREARWALDVPDGAGGGVRRYADTGTRLGPRSVSEATDLVAALLGPLIAYDDEHNSELVHTLDLFLRLNRSWQETSRQLFIHKQTLVYRMKRVEELTEKKVTETAVLAEFWYALRAREVIGK